MNFTVLQAYLQSHMDVEKEDFWLWLGILSDFETAMPEFIHPWDLPCPGKQQRLRLGDAEPNPPPGHRWEPGLSAQLRGLPSIQLPKRNPWFLFPSDRGGNGEALQDSLSV